MEKLSEKARRACAKWHSTPGPASAPASASGVQLPPTFHSAHSTLARYAEEMTFAPPRVRTPQPSMVKDAAIGPWLPDVYRFANVGVGVEERYRIRDGSPGSSGGDGEKFATAQPTPFMPSEPRIAANDSFDFEHGALTAELAETSYMAWF